MEQWLDILEFDLTLMTPTLLCWIFLVSHIVMQKGRAANHVFNQFTNPVVGKSKHSEIVTKASDVHHLCHSDVKPLSPWLGCALRLTRERRKTKRKNVLP